MSRPSRNKKPPLAFDEIMLVVPEQKQKPRSTKRKLSKQKLSTPSLAPTNLTDKDIDLSPEKVRPKQSGTATYVPSGTGTRNFYKEGSDLSSEESEMSSDHAESSSRYKSQEDRSHATETTPERRKRGRPRKIVDTSLTGEPVKRKRGRPRKIVEDDGVPKEKRKRGRPRKVVEDNGEPQVKRKRGRPRKYPKPDSDADEGSGYGTMHRGGLSEQSYTSSASKHTSVAAESAGRVSRPFATDGRHPMLDGMYEAESTFSSTLSSSASEEEEETLQSTLRNHEPTHATHSSTDQNSTQTVRPETKRQEANHHETKRQKANHQEGELYDGVASSDGELDIVIEPAKSQQWDSMDGRWVVIPPNIRDNYIPQTARPETKRQEANHHETKRQKANHKEDELHDGVASSDGELDIVIEPAKSQQWDSMDGRWVVIPPNIRDNYIPQTRRQIIDILAGKLPHAGKDEKGDYDGSECIGLQDQWHSLRSTLRGTLHGEGNSALLVGAPGSGKSLLIDSVLRSLQSGGSSSAFHLVHLDAALQTTDRMSLRELARQLVRAGAIKLPEEGEEGALDLGWDTQLYDEEEQQLVEQQAARAEQERRSGGGKEVGTQSDEEGEGEDPSKALENAVLSSLASTTSTILTLLSSGQASAKSNLPLVIVLESFELFTARARKALLYVLLDAVQAGSYTPGLCVLGTTSRVDTTDLLEKRVRSRFSGRVIDVWPGAPWMDAMRRALMAGIPEEDSDDAHEYRTEWEEDVNRLCQDTNVKSILDQWQAMGNDFATLYRILFPIVASLSTSHPSIHARFLQNATCNHSQPASVLNDLATPEFALLIAAKHLVGRDREVFNFAMCYDELKRFVARIERDRLGAGTGGLNAYSYSNATSSPLRRPGQASSVGVSWKGLVDRKRVMMAFRTLLGLELFQPESLVHSQSMSAVGIQPATTSNTPASAAALTRKALQAAGPEFLRVRCTLFPQSIVQAAKSKTRAEPLEMHLVQWASSTV